MNIPLIGRDLMTIKKRLSKSNMYMFLIPMLAAAVLLILGLFFNFLAVFAFMIVRDRPARRAA